ncbi:MULTISPECIES: NADH-quinone oxidoreductase subunit K [unclassified Arsukibacterium]|uniref:NADH-quinone oxidoreductase subunit K n=1 Tax=unclassified Arsukibacterium TaxID=2635278 RepID=UPI000C468024|nr:MULTISPECIES: NADH-quinone oxidoreductase subunit K [unclassified Arsukibacterium]MAA96214.1 hypothetical protein [Rheinheimera sp.]MBM35039.1 hypothetical protein [Rheinheimera sp.]HAW92409.1 hypothetical protein [Candidatus Azambacteria bacterium]|tara:strand:- start:498 stop:860 length:363 start_codon:yes stop_codon:yes gene_type:complete
MTELSATFIVFAFTAASLIAIGFYSFITGPEPLRRILALNIISAGIFMLMVVLAYRGYDDTAVSVGDPVLQALVLTGLVVAVSATAFALAMLARLEQQKPEQQKPEQNRVAKSQISRPEQ